MGSSKKCAEQHEIDEYLVQRPFMILQFDLEVYDFSLNAKLTRRIKKVITLNGKGGGQLKIQR
jgi:hypothetical protein